MPKKQYYIHDNEVYEKVKNKFFSTYKQIDIPKQDTLVPEWHGKKIPLSMWQEILAFMKYSYDELKSETMCFLYYDEKKKQPWSFWVPPQITNGMTVKSDPEHMNFQAQRAQYPDIMFGTVHHHCSSSAFQSGTDEADETNREGFHFTIGNLNKPDDIDIHFRWCLDNECHELEDLSIAIDGAESPFKNGIELSEAMLEIDTEYKNEQFAHIPDVTKYDFTSYMDNVSRPKAPASKKLGYYNSDWYDTWTQNNLKKNTVLKEEDPIDAPIEYATEDDIVDEMVFNSMFDNDFEEALIEYITSTTSDNDDIMEITKGTILDHKVARHIYEAYTRQINPFCKKVEKILDQYSNKYNMDRQQIVVALQNYCEYEERVYI